MTETVLDRYVTYDRKIASRRLLLIIAVTGALLLIFGGGASWQYFFGGGLQASTFSDEYYQALYGVERPFVMPPWLIGFFIGIGSGFLWHVGGYYLNHYDNALQGTVVTTSMSGSKKRPKWWVLVEGNNHANTLCKTWHVVTFEQWLEAKADSFIDLR